MIYYKVGTVAYAAQWFWDDGESELFAAYGPGTHAPTLDVAKNFLHLNRGVDKDGGRWWCRIDKGTYVDSSFNDPDYGHIDDSTFETDDDFYCVGSVNDDGSIEWDEQG